MYNLEELVKELIRYPDETPWLEFKHNNYNPQMIAADISALANSAALHDKECAYMLWGIDDKTHAIVGTDYNLQTLKKGEQELENWLRSLLSKNAEFEFQSVEMNNLTVGVLIIYKATNQTVTYEKVDYIRIGSYTKKLNEHPSVQAQLWEKIRNIRFEERPAIQNLSLQDAVSKLQYSLYFDLKNEPLPTSIDGISHYMLEEQFIKKQDNGLYEITNLGAILLSKKLSEFPRLSRKAIRIVKYADNSRLSILKEDTIDSGYVSTFKELLKYIEALLPSREVINGAVREKISAYPIIAIREAVANALIHQDFSLMGTGPVIEIFSDKIEITNPGTPLIDIKRIIDNPPRSRNEKIAEVMRRLRMCEELGTGWDKIVVSCELMQLPAPKINLYEENTKVTLFSEKKFSDISIDEKIWACYLHACIKYVQGDFLTNSSLRDRFGLSSSSSGSVSRLIKEALERNYIKALDLDTAPRYMKYIPVWA